jgi:hypothetical protein
MSAVYGNYARSITRTSPFVWAHRLDIPSFLGTAAIILSLIAGFAIGSASAELNRAGFFTLMFLCLLATLFWLVLLSRTLDLRYSLKASKYPIYSVVVIGAAIINAPPFVFSNVAEMGYYSTPPLDSWRLFTSYLSDSDAWGRSGLMLYLALISLAVLFALLIRRSSFYAPFLSSFICCSILLSSILYAALFAGKREGALAFVIVYIIASAVAVACGIATYLRRLQKHQDVIFGVILFSFSPASIFLLCIMLSESGLLPIPGFERDPSFWVIIPLVCLGLGLNELTFSLMRKTRRYAS